MRAGESESRGLFFGFAFILAGASAFWFAGVFGALSIGILGGFPPNLRWPAATWLVLGMLSGFFAVRLASKARFLVIPCLLWIGMGLFQFFVQHESASRGLTVELVFLTQAGVFWLVKRRNQERSVS